MSLHKMGINETDDFAAFCLSNFTYDQKTGNIIRKHGKKKGLPIKFSKKTNSYKAVRIVFKNKTIDLRLHRLVWLLYYKNWPKKEIDHINGIKFDNRVENLREISHSSNQHNSNKIKSDNTSGVMGVRKGKNGYGWQANINFKRKAAYLGQYKTKKEAESVYFAAKTVVHPEWVGDYKRPTDEKCLKAIKSGLKKLRKYVDYKPIRDYLK